MRLLAAILIAIQAFTMVICPMGDLQYAKNLAGMYDQCAAEDPDIDAADFVLEHLMNLECVMAMFEGDEQEQGERPHQPVQVQVASQTMVIVTKPIILEVSQSCAVIYTPREYPLFNDAGLPSGYLADIFRPPAA